MFAACVWVSVGVGVGGCVGCVCGWVGGGGSVCAEPRVWAESTPLLTCFDPVLPPTPLTKPTHAPTRASTHTHTGLHAVRAHGGQRRTAEGFHRLGGAGQGRGEGAGREGAGRWMCPRWGRKTDGIGGVGALNEHILSRTTPPHPALLAPRPAPRPSSRPALPADDDHVPGVCRAQQPAAPHGPALAGHRRGRGLSQDPG